MHESAGKQVIGAADIIGMFQRIAETMEREKQYLVDLDSAVGDGDLGLTMSRGFRSAARELKDSAEKDIGTLLLKAGMVLARTAPSTMGTLMAIGLMKGGKSAAGSVSMGLEDLAGTMKSIVDAMMEKGKSKPGEKTVIDSLGPAQQALEEAAAGGKSLTESLGMARDAAALGVEDTKRMIAKHGRVAYYGEKSLGKPDPGAAAGMLAMKAVAEYAGEM